MGVAERDESLSLAEFHLSTLAVNTELKTDNSVLAAVCLKSSTLTDLRPGKDAGITQYVMPSFQILHNHSHHFAQHSITSSGFLKFYSAVQKYAKDSSKTNFLSSDLFNLKMHQNQIQFSAGAPLRTPLGKSTTLPKP